MTGARHFAKERERRQRADIRRRRRMSSLSVMSRATFRPHAPDAFGICNACGVFVTAHALPNCPGSEPG